MHSFFAALLLLQAGPAFIVAEGAEPVPEFRVVADDPDAAHPEDQTVMEAQAAFEQYFAAYERGDDHTTFAMLSDGLAAMGTFAEWTQSNQRTRDEQGAMNRAISRISWYVDPNNAAGPGTYVALDFVGATENSPVYCGYVVLRPAADQGFEVVRVEQNFIDRGSYESMADREPDDPLPVLNCHFGPYRMLIPAS